MSEYGASFVKGSKDSKGNIRPEGSNNSGGSTVEELSSHEEVKQAELDGDTIVAELSGRVRSKEEGERVFGVDLDSEHLSKFFTEDEIEELEKAESITSGKDRDIDDKSYDEIRNEMRQEVDEIYREERREHALKDAQRVEDTRDWLKPDYKSQSVQDMDGETFMRAISQAMSEDSTEEELARHSEEDLEDLLELEKEPEIDNPLTEAEELEAAEAFERRAKKKGKSCWTDIKNDIEMSNPQTRYESIGSNSRKITTEEEELQKHLRNPSSDFDGKITILQDTGSVVEAVVEKGT